ncbi:MAG: hypothetical protein ACREDK_02255 [Thermoplasmata archaeon]
MSRGHNAVVAILVVSVLSLSVLSLAGTSSAAGQGQSPTGPPFLSYLTHKFNGQSIKAGDTIWFTADIHLVGPPIGTNGTAAGSSNLTIEMYNQTLTFTMDDGTTFAKHVPAGDITFSTTATSASTKWDSAHPGWDTIIPLGYNAWSFVVGFAYYVGSGGLPGHVNVNWSAQFSSPQCYFDFIWMWHAAVYTQFAGNGSASNDYPYTTANYGSVDVKPVDGPHWSAYANGDQRGTPENFLAYVTGGADGGGGSAVGGSSGATHVTKPQCY